MKTTIVCSEAGTFGLRVNGRLEMDKESLGVVAQVQYFLDNEQAWADCEAWELAESIRSAGSTNNSGDHVTQ